MIDSRRSESPYRSQNLRDPRNLQQETNAGNIVEDFTSLTGQIHNYGRRLLTRTGFDQKQFASTRNFFLKNEIPFTVKIQKLFLGNLFSSNKASSSVRPIKTKAFGNLTPTEAAQIIIEQRGQFELLKQDLRKSGAVTHAGVQQVLLRSALQFRMNDIESERQAAPISINEARKTTESLTRCSVRSSSSNSKARQAVARTA
mmetsp:Transcript_15771/g.22526  ORF Transcript_15771/g.22526 Transcript_15771/m.22526 type:complete len:201 (-) Transcript_15771:94-696(-)